MKTKTVTIELTEKQAQFLFDHWHQNISFGGGGTLANDALDDVDKSKLNQAITIESKIRRAMELSNVPLYEF